MASRDREVGLSTRSLHDIFPFHLALDQQCQVIQHGGAIGRLCPGLRRGDHIAQHLRLIRPPISLEFIELERAAPEFVMAELVYSGQLLRGQTLVTDVGVLFLVSPWITDPAQLDAGDLRLSDFALHDPVLDYVALLQTKGTALKDASRLAAKLSESNVELEQARARAEQANDAKSSFLAMISHEMRSPLGVIVGLAELIEDDAPKAERADFLRRIRTNARALAGIIEDVLDLSKLEAGSVRFEHSRFRPISVVEDVAESLAERASDKGLELIVSIGPEIPAVVRGDQARLRQVLVNLVGNAIKFTDAGEVELLVECVGPPSTEARLRYSVRDTGRGIPEQMKGEIFERFTRVEGPGRSSVAGTGLGLSICRLLVGGMGSEIHLETREGEGSLFRFELLHLVPDDAHAGDPEQRTYEVAQRHARKRAQTASLKPARRPPSGSLGRVLIVDDDPDNLLILEHVARRHGLKVDQAADGVAALRKLEDNEYSFLVTDLQMPNMDGFELTQRIREREASDGLPRMPIVAVTAHALRDHSDRAVSAGMDEFLTKPVHLPALSGAFDRCLDRAGAAPGMSSRPPWAGGAATDSPGQGTGAVQTAIDPDVVDLIPGYLENRRKDVESLRAALSGDLGVDTMASIGHKMKGTGQAYGLPRVTELGAAIELAGQDGRRDEIGELVDELESHLDEIEVQFRGQP